MEPSEPDAELLSFFCHFNKLSRTFVKYWPDGCGGIIRAESGGWTAGGLNITGGDGGRGCAQPLKTTTSIRKHTTHNQAISLTSASFICDLHLMLLLLFTSVLGGCLGQRVARGGVLVPQRLNFCSAFLLSCVHQVSVPSAKRSGYA